MHDEEVGPRLASFGDCDGEKHGEVTEDDEDKEDSTEGNALPLYQ